MRGKGVGKREDPRRVALIPRDYPYYLYNQRRRSYNLVISRNTLTLKKEKKRSFQLEQLFTASKDFEMNKNAAQRDKRFAFTFNNLQIHNDIICLFILII